MRNTEVAQRVKNGGEVGNYYQIEQEIEAVVEGFEQCTTGKDEFSHLSHLTVATWYLRRYSPAEAFEKMRDGLFRFLDHHGIDRAKYKEQLTRDWMALVAGVMEQMDPEASLVDATNVVVDRLGKFRIPEPSSRNKRLEADTACRLKSN